jgi:hypothetical protein
VDGTVGVGEKLEGAREAVEARAGSVLGQAEGAGEALAKKADRVLDQAVQGTKEQVSGERVGTHPYGDVDSRATIESEGPGGVKEAKKLLNGVGSMTEMDMFKQKKVADVENE